MRYNDESDKIEISVSELVRLARVGCAASVQKDEDEPSAGRLQNDTQPIRLEFSVDGVELTLSGKRLEKNSTAYVHSFPVGGSPLRPDKAEIEQARGEAYILAYMELFRDSKSEPCRGSINLQICYINSESGEQAESLETVTRAKLSRFFDKCAAALEGYAEAECERVKLRLPSMASAAFPYKEMREGQREFIRSAYRTMARGGELFAIAPTGTGKTVSALFPALRALGDGRCEKVFYLTPKTTTAEAARDCLELFAKEGVRLRAVILSAKERACTSGLVCRESKRLCASLSSNRLKEAVFSLYREGMTVAALSDFRRVGTEFGVCPYELALSYSELCDVIICDFNYLFDPRVYIRRFFTESGSYAFLIDEAHNLADRARDMYSAEVSELTLSTLANSPHFGEFSAAKEASSRLSQALRELLFPLIKEELRQDADGNRYGAYHTHNLPGELFGLFGKARDACDRELKETFCAKDEQKNVRVKALREYIHLLDRFIFALSRFDDGFEFFVFFEDEKIRAKIFCLDTGGVIRDRLRLGRSAVFFSGTLSPTDYYKQVLGGDRSSCVLKVDSPFVPEQLKVAVMDKISTRYSEREDTLLAICRGIAATLSAKRGNYMVFAPSFAYAEAIYKSFSAKYPKIRTLCQKSNMTAMEKAEFLDAFSKSDGNYLVAFCVMGGIYSEGIDLTGDKLIGAVIVGIGMPTPTYEREAIAAYYDEKLEAGKLYAYIYPGMNKVLQAAGRVIRCEDDRGVIVLIDDRFDDPIYKKTAPTLWRGMQFFSDPKSLKESLERFWAE